jgi:hypothetical protein
VPAKRILGGRYRLGELLGAGGMSIVYRATDLRLGREVAVKLLPPNLAADALVARRFEAEARRVAAIAHPNLVTIHDVGEDLGDPFYVMEVIEGETLEQQLRRQGQLPLTAVAGLTTELAGALDALHAEHLMHRDVKPANILMSADGHAHLADFGLVRGEPDGVTAPGIAVGTLSYLAPELLRGDDATEASDTYALAAVTYRALAGTLPYAARTIADLVEAQAALPAPVSTLRPDASPDIDAVLLAALGPIHGRPKVMDFAAAFASAVETTLVKAPDVAAVAMNAAPLAVGMEERAGTDAARAPAWLVGPPAFEAQTQVDTVLNATSPQSPAPAAVPVVPLVIAADRPIGGPPHARAASIAIAAVFLFAVAAAAGFPRSSQQAVAGEFQAVGRPVPAAVEPSATQTPAPVALVDTRKPPSVAQLPKAEVARTGSSGDESRHKNTTKNHAGKHDNGHAKKHDDGHAKKHDNKKHDKKKHDKKKHHRDHRGGGDHGGRDHGGD